MGIVHSPRKPTDQHPQIKTLPFLAASLQGKRCVVSTSTLILSILWSLLETSETKGQNYDAT